ncbi:hypothetical protein CBW52_13475 [Yersinia kristensenii]|uniref:Nucleotidyl transferase AbiEii/AbiGii toxin family protein n=1 Tax=Yersinia kristensenii TaxID=28152 RepID=A0AB73NIK9_YERKR|nr:hypothetical protein CBW52_13475 [Yersinia kristensenii]
MVASETCFALKGGAAINQLIRNFPFLSVDIDLVYVPRTALFNSANQHHSTLYCASLSRNPKI